MLALNILLFGCIVVILIISTAILLTVTAIDRVTAILLKRSDAATSGEKNSRQDAQDQQDRLGIETNYENGSFRDEAIRLVRDIKLNEKPQSGEITPRFSPGQTVFAKERMEWMYGNSCDVPKGAKIVLEAVAQTSHGWRYSGRWKNVYLSSIPEESLELGPESNLQIPGALPEGGDVWPVDLDSGAVEFAWDFRDMNHNTLESGTEATQEAARQMVQAAYEKHVASQTSEIEQLAEQPVESNHV